MIEGLILHPVVSSVYRAASLDTKAALAEARGGSLAEANGHWVSGDGLEQQ